MIKLSVSTHMAKNNLMDYVKEISGTDADMLHCDIMDGNFVSDTTFDYHKVAEINASTTALLDVHLMIENPHKYVAKYIEAGANILTIHYEAFKSRKLLMKTIGKIRESGRLAGLSIKPSTPISEIEFLLPILDLVLIMSVQPGKSGQKFIESSLTKIETLKKIINKNAYKILIEVDGGVNENNYQEVAEAGADILVMGSGVYNSKNKQEFIDKIRQA